MTKFYKFLFLLVAILTTSPVINAADTLDDEGYPYMYVRGTECTGWAAQEAYKFTRTGSTYTITLASLNGDFKISGDTWQYNVGADQTITESTIITCVQDGENIKASSLTNVTISFDFVPSGSSMPDTEVTFVVNGEEPTPTPTPTPSPVDETSGTLPILYINVYQYDEDAEAYVTDSDGNMIIEDEVIDMNLAHKEYFHGQYWLDVNDCQWLMDLGAESIGTEEEPLELEIKARGNYTRTAFAKKPFKLKLGSKQNLLNMNINGKKSKHWAILAHADDNKGYLRNFVMFTLGEMIGLPWTPRQQPVEVIINGDYRGVYFLTESIRVGDGRVPVEELEDEEASPALISGGYIVELDNYDEDDDSQIRMEEKGQADVYKDRLRITFDTPEVYSSLQRQFITDQFTAMNDAIGDNSDTMWSYLDLDDLVRYYIVEEIISHVESFHGSTYLFRDRGEGQKWHFSPLWDGGNGFNGSTSKFLYNNSPFGNTWIPSLRLNDTFNAKLKETWQWFMGSQLNTKADLIAAIDEYVERVSAAAIADRKRWKDAPTPQQGVCDNSDMASRRDEVVKHLNAKINWLAQQSDFGSIGGNFSEPERDDTEAAPLPSYAKEPSPEDYLTFYFIDDSENPWSSVSAYIWGPSEDGITNNEALGAWPGTSMTATTLNGQDAWIISIVPTHMPAMEGESTAKVIFSNDGDTDTQTSSLELANGNIYYRSGQISGVDLETSDAIEADAQYFDILGRPVAKPAPGAVYIKRVGSNVTKVVL